MVRIRKRKKKERKSPKKHSKNEGKDEIRFFKNDFYFGLKVLSN